MKHFLNIAGKAPDHIRIITETGAAADTSVDFRRNGCGADVFVTAQADAVKYVLLRWNADLGEPLRILGDDWERAYGTLEWRGIVKQRIMPWYFLIAYTDGVCGYGVRVRPSALCSFTVDNGGITLRLDLRNGTKGVLLPGRTVKAATIVCESYEGVSEFEAAGRFCALMCDDPLLPEKPVYGGNNWYYAYGKSSRSEILGDCRYIASLCAGNENPPHMIIDDGWQCNVCSGPWDRGNDAFGDMGTLAAEMKETGVIPGIWVRLLHDASGTIPEPQRLKGNPALLDPSHPDALAHIAADISRIRGWGYRLLKHDYSTFDIFGRYGIDMTERLTDGDWCFFDRSRTTAEIILRMYEVILESAGDMVIMGCNTLSHLCAGLVHINRTGDDTSGREWERTRRLGVNTMAFRLCQHNRFYVADADCAGITPAVPWYYNKQWVRLLGESGTPLFVSSKPGDMNEEQMSFVSEMFRKSAAQADVLEPLDWTVNTCPQRWRINGEEIRFDFFEQEPNDLLP